MVATAKKRQLIFTGKAETTSINEDMTDMKT